MGRFPRFVDYLSFDIEIYEELEFDENGSTKYDGIIPTIGAYTVDGVNVEFYYDLPYMSKETGKKLILDMYKKAQEGFMPVAWNGMSFDFRVMANYTGLVEECAHLALSSFDQMLSVMFRKGYPIKLDKALISSGLESKVHSVTLNDGTVLEDMSGIMAPKLWQDGEVDAVKAYISGDVIQPYKLTKQVEETSTTKWLSQKGKNMSCFTPVQPVHALFNLAEPDLSWMKDAKFSTRSDVIDWIPEEILKLYYIDSASLERKKVLKDAE